MPRNIQSIITQFHFNHSSQTSILAVALLVICLFGQPPAAQAQTTVADTVHYNIPQGSLEQALGLFSRQSGIALSSDADKIKDTATSGLEGAWTQAPTQWTTLYLQNLLNQKWEQSSSPAGAAVCQSAATSATAGRSARDNRRCQRPPPVGRGHRGAAYARRHLHSNLQGGRAGPRTGTGCRGVRSSGGSFI